MKLSYLAVLGFCAMAVVPLELFLRTRVLARPRRLALTLLPVLAVFLAWDLYAISRGHWRYDPRQMTGIVLPGSLPLEELLFFVVIPIVSILTLEAARRVKHGKPGWEIGDEPAASGPEPAGEGR